MSNRVAPANRDRSAPPPNRRIGPGSTKLKIENTSSSTFSSYCVYFLMHNIAVLDFLPALCDAGVWGDWYMPWLSCHVIIAARFRSGLGLDPSSNTVTLARLLQPRDDADVERYYLSHPSSWASSGLHNDTTQRRRELCLIGSYFLTQMPDTRGSHSR